MKDIQNAIAQLDWKREPYGLYEPIEYILNLGGKRLRPMLAVLASQIFNGNKEDVIPAALALEVFHNFTLLHDDVMDKADMRRGHPTVHTKWNENTAILSGDQMMIEAYKQLALLPDDKLPQVLRWFNEMATAICEGQQYDIDFESSTTVAISDYLMMIEKKTALLLAYSLRIGAYIAGASEQEQDALFQYGRHIGIAFQIQDDVLDVYGDPSNFGKAIGGDICCNKKTFLLLTALDIADAESKASLLQWLITSNKNAEKIQAVTALYTQLGVREIGEAVMEDHTAEALAQLELLPQNDYTNQLRVLAEKLATRKR
ncbi:MAG: polyprenyl synthetase family protein [Paludibacteraceae bacterium]|nr:polyprenyl synthetase family protein [Paludibacteraceae bacterium]